MSRPFYENFELVISRGAEKAYKASVRSELGGDNSVTFSLDQAPAEVLKGITRNFALGAVASDPSATADPAAATAPPEVGKYLFEQIFQGSMLVTFKDTRDRARSRNAFLRIQLNLTDVPELVGLPWEMMRWDSDNLALSMQTSVVRYQNVTFPRDQFAVEEKPLRMLAVISSPKGAPPLKVEDEWNRIQEALKTYTDLNLIELERLPRVTLTELDNRLLDTGKPPLHILHFIGHGTFDEAQKAGQLLFEADDQTAGNGNGAEGFELVSGQRLADSLRNHDSLRLALLNSCEGAMVSTTDSYAGVAQQLLQAGNVPVVIAMRRVISDDLAVAFAKTFYEWLLVKNLSVDAAMTRSRLIMRDVEQKAVNLRKETRTPTEWATPILFIRKHDGYLVNFDDVPQVIVPADLPEESDPQMATHYKTVLNALTKGKLVPFLGLDVNLFGRAPVAKWKPNSGMLPSYRELVEYLATYSQHPFPFVPALADVSQYALLHSDDEGTFYEDLISIFTQANAPTDLHKFWATVAAHNSELTGSAPGGVVDINRRFMIVSSTYDNLLESAFKETLDRFHVVSYVAHGDYAGKFRHTVYANTGGQTVAQTTVTAEPANNYGGLFDQAPVILKIPGTVGDTAGPRFAITEDQYLDFLTKRELANILPSQLLTKLRNSNHLFLGFNVREWSLRALLYRIWEDHKAPFASWTVLEPLTDLDSKYWSACNVKIVERGLTPYLAGLRQSCQALLPTVKF
jgi:CHAT domain/SIR2-like domain